MTARLCECTCKAWGHPGVCDGRDVCTLTAETPRPEWNLWPAANTGTFRLCPPCVLALRQLVDRLAVWDMNIEAYGYPTYDMFIQAEVDRLTGRLES